MKTYTIALVLALVVLSGIGLAQLDWPTPLPWGDVPCTDPIYVNPGETMILNGTAVPPQTTPSTDVNYCWIVWKGTTPYQVYDYQSPHGPLTPASSAFLNFSAPVEEGCYKALLTVYFNRTVTTGESPVLFQDCINQTCFEFCVNKSSCPLCRDIFCSGDEPDVIDPCNSDTEDCPACVCFENYTTGLMVNWNVTLRSSGTEVTSFNREGECAAWDWSSSDINNDTYLVNMSVYGPQNEGYRPFYYSCTGNVSRVETPVASIRRE